MRRFPNPFFCIFWLIPTCLILLLMLSGCYGTRVAVEHRSPGHGRVSAPPHEPGPPPWAPAHGYRAKHRYHYYPDSGVYFDTGRGVYFYYGDGRWRVSVSLPTRFRIHLGDYVTLEMDSARPYEYHDEVMRRYPPGPGKRRGRK